jgi:putative lipoprotein
VYRDKTALPADAEVSVQLLDVSRPDHAFAVAETKIVTAGKQVPIAFEMPVDVAKATGRLHALYANIRWGGQIRYVTTTRVIIVPATPPEALTMVVVPGDSEPVLTDSPMPRTGPNRGPPPGMIPPRSSDGPPTKR